MSLLTEVLVEPWYRLIYGPPAPALSRLLREGAPPPGLVLVADGVGGPDLCAVGLKYVIPNQGLPWAVENLAWGHGLGRWYKDLSDVANQLRQARQAARLVQEFRQHRPYAPVFLVGKSGGTGVVVHALEELAPASVASTVLLAPALSPDYDLSRALRAVRGEMVVFYSPLDLLVLGAGTRIFGTIDRVRSAAAGLVQFRLPPGLDDAGRAGYRRLRQVGWRPSMITSGHLGGHMGTDSPRFLKKFVTPLLRNFEPGES